MPKKLVRNVKQKKEVKSKNIKKSSKLIIKVVQKNNKTDLKSIKLVKTKLSEDLQKHRQILRIKHLRNFCTLLIFM